MLEAHRRIGWRLLLNDHQMIQLGDASMAILGVENWEKGVSPNTEGSRTPIMVLQKLM